MITIELLIVLLIGFAIMCGIMILQMRHYTVSLWKSFVVALVLVVTGVWASELWYFVENLHFGGRSFFGAIFISPVIFFPVAKMLRVSYEYILDFIPSAGCVTLALVKIQCMQDNCCQGKVLYIDENYFYVRFPSQILEMINFLLLSVVLFILSYKLRRKGQVFPWFLVLYGLTRFVLNSFRGELTPYALGMSAGHFWSIVSLVLGIAWLLVLHFKNKKKQVKSV